MDRSGVRSRDKTEPKWLVSNNEYFTDPLRKLSVKAWAFFIASEKQFIISCNIQRSYFQYECTVVEKLLDLRYKDATYKA